MFKVIRIFILLLILAAVALGTWREKSRSLEWKYALPVNIYLINGDGSVVTAEYLHGLKLADFKPIEAFMKEEAARYGHESQASIEISMGGLLPSHPPLTPSKWECAGSHHLEFENALVGVSSCRNKRCGASSQTLFALF